MAVRVYRLDANQLLRKVKLLCYFWNSSVIDAGPRVPLHLALWRSIKKCSCIRSRVPRSIPRSHLFLRCHSTSPTLCAVEPTQTYHVPKHFTTAGLKAFLDIHHHCCIERVHHNVLVDNFL